MKKVCISFLAGLGGLLLVGGAMADDNLFTQGYVGVSYYQLEQDDRFFGDSRFDTGELFVRVVGNINEYFSSELRLGATVADNTDSGIEFRHNYLVTGLLRAGWPLGPVTPYLAVGHTWGEERWEFSGTAQRATFNDWSYGAGIDMDLGERLGVSLEMIQHYENLNGNVSLRGAGLGAYWRF